MILTKGQEWNKMTLHSSKNKDDNAFAHILPFSFLKTSLHDNLWDNSYSYIFRKTANQLMTFSCNISHGNVIGIATGYGLDNRGVGVQVLV
jgi:hypothetical protein